MLAYVLLGVAQVVGLSSIPAGYPGVWLQLAALAAYGWWSEFAEVGVVPLAVLTLISLSAEVTTLVATANRGDPDVRRIGFWTLAGGVGGAMAGFWIPAVGSLFGAFCGSLLGAVAGAARERRRRDRGSKRSPSPGAGTLLGLTMRVAAGVAVATFALLESLAGS